MILITFSNLEKDASQWQANISASVNASQSAGFQASSLPDGRLLVSNVGSSTWAGGLVARKLQVPQFTGAGSAPLIPAYAQLKTHITVPLLTAYNLGRLETDLIAVFTAAPNASTPTSNKGNNSTQLNLNTGHFEVDASAGTSAWSDIGSGPGSIVPDVEHELIIRCGFDLPNAKRSVFSIWWDGVAYPVPAALQGIPFQPSNWGQVVAIQKQNEMFKPGATDVIYRGTELSWSDQPF